MLLAVGGSDDRLDAEDAVVQVADIDLLLVLEKDVDEVIGVDLLLAQDRYVDEVIVRVRVVWIVRVMRTVEFAEDGYDREVDLRCG